MSDSHASQSHDSHPEGPSSVLVPEAPVAGPPAAQGGGCVKVLVIGCITVIVLAIVAVVLGFVFRQAIGNWFVGKGFDVARGVVRETELPEKDKELIVGRIDEVQRQFESGEITGEALAMILPNTAGYVVPGILHFAVVEEIKKSALTPEEKASGTIAAERVARGGFDGNIESAAILGILERFEGDGESSLSEEALRSLITELSALADEHNIPDEGFEVNYAEEAIRAIDIALDMARAQTAANSEADSEK